MGLGRLRSRLTGPTYRCEGCALTYEREFSTCPACGFGVSEAT
jgi:rRNA maturation endonuclease Nob1